MTKNYSPIPCKYCGITIERNAPNHYFCDDCKIVRNREKDKIRSKRWRDSNQDKVAAIAVQKRDRVYFGGLMIKALERDLYTCQDCGLKQAESKRQLDVHHIDCDSSHNEMSNLVTLCMSCHQKRHWRELGRKTKAMK